MSFLSRYGGRESSLTRIKPPLPPLPPPSLPINPVPPNNNTNDPISDPELPNNVERHTKRPDIVIEQSLPLPAPTNPTFGKILAQKIKICEIECDFQDPDADKKAKSIKTSTLNELAELSANSTLLAQISQEQFDMLFNLLVQKLLEVRKDVPAKFLFSDDVVKLTEYNWPHKKIFYQILLSLFQSAPENSNFNLSFLRKVNAAFAAPDFNEEAQLATIMIQSKSSLPQLQREVINMMCTNLVDVFNKAKSPHVLIPTMTVLLDTFSSCSIKELSNYLNIYLTYILPLFGILHYTLIASQIMRITEIFLEGISNQVAYPILMTLIRCFPRTKSTKMIEFLQLIPFALAKVTIQQFRENMMKIFTIYAQCTCSSHVKVSEASLAIWNSIEIESSIMDHATIIFPRIYPILSSYSREAWSPDIQSNITYIFQVMNRIDSFLFQELCRSRKQLENSSNMNDDLKKWATIARTAARSDRRLNLAVKLSEIQRTFTSSSFSISRPTPSSNPYRNNSFSRLPIGSRLEKSSTPKPVIFRPVI